MLKYIRNKTAGIEPWWTLVCAPIFQEFIFRFLPYQFIYKLTLTNEFWTIGLISSFLFATIHWYFGKWFVIYSFVWGLILWWLMVKYGLIMVIAVHAIANLLHIQLGIIKIQKINSPDNSANKN